MNYEIENRNGELYIVKEAHGLIYGGPYGTEAKAKRRIRDLKAKEMAEPAECPVDTRIERENQAIVDALPFRQIGCYPYLKKSQYVR